MSVSELVSGYLFEKAPAWSAVTLVGQRRRLQLFVDFLEKGGFELSRSCILAFVRHARARKTPKGKPWADVTLLGVLVAARGFFKWALLRGHLLEDLHSLIPSPQVAQLPRSLSERDTRTLIEAGPRGPCALRDRAVLELLYGTGLRAQELCRLQLDDVDLQSGLVFVRQGKGRKDRLLPLGEKAKAAVLCYLRHERPRRAGWLFLTKAGRPLRTKALGSLVCVAGKRAGLRGFASPHRLRHSYATHLLRNGAGVAELKALLGHARLSSTEVYLGLEITDLQRMLEKSHPRERGL